MTQEQDDAGAPASVAAPLRVALVQMCSGTDPDANLDAIEAHARAAAAGGAAYVLTPEMSVLFAASRDQLIEGTAPFESNPAIPRLSALARETGLYLHLGSMALPVEDGRFVNRSLLFAPDGTLAAAYDKIHLFDADVPGDRAYRESMTYRGGSEAVVVPTPLFALGLSICYDVRFPALYRVLAEAGAQVLAVPAAFTVPTGAAHWQVLLRARAIETGCFVLAAAQGGRHANGRETYGHSLVVDPWGTVIASAEGAEAGVVFAELDLDAVGSARQRVPALANAREFSPSVNHKAQG